MDRSERLIVNLAKGLFILLLIVLPLSYGQTEIFRLGITFFFLALPASLLLILMISKGRIYWQDSPVNKWFYVFILMIVVQLAGAFVPYPFRFIPKSRYLFATELRLYEWLAFGGVLFLISTYVRERSDFKFIFRGLLLSGYLTAFLFLINFLLKENVFVQWEQTRFLPGLQWLQLHPNRNFQAGYFALLLPLVTGQLLYQLKREGHHGWRYFLSHHFLWSLMLLMLIASAYVLTGSRTALIGFLLFILSAFAIVMRILKTRRARIFLTVLLFLLLLFIYWLGRDFFPETYRLMLNPDIYPTFHGRTALWKNALEVWKLFPLFGAGFGTWVLSFYNFHFAAPEWFSVYIMNDFVKLWTETGFFFSFVLLSGLGITLYTGIRDCVRSKSRFIQYYGSACLGSILLLAFHGMTISNFEDMTNSFIFFVLLFVIAHLSTLVFEVHDQKHDMLLRMRIIRVTKVPVRTLLSLVVSLVFFALTFRMVQIMRADQLLQTARMPDLKLAQKINPLDARIPARTGALLLMKSQMNPSDEVGQLQSWMTAREAYAAAKNLNVYQSDLWLRKLEIDLFLGNVERGMFEYEAYFALAPNDVKAYVDYANLCFHFLSQPSQLKYHLLFEEKAVWALKEALEINHARAALFINFYSKNWPARVLEKLKV